MTINNIAVAPMKPPHNKNEQATRQGLAAELFHLRATAAHLQTVSKFQFRRVAKQLVDIATTSSNEVETIRSQHARVRSEYLKVREDGQQSNPNPIEPRKPQHDTDGRATVIVHGLPPREQLERGTEMDREGQRAVVPASNGLHSVSRALREMISSHFGEVLAVTVRQRSLSKSWALVTFATASAADALFAAISQGLLLTWPPTANTGTLLSFGKLEQSTQLSSSAAFDATWSKHKSAVRIARVALLRFEQFAQTSESSRAALSATAMERARVKALRENYLAELEDLSKLDLSIRQAMLAEHAARTEATKITEEEAFFYINFLRQVPFFGDAGIPDDSFKGLVTQMEILKYDEDAIIVQEGTVATECFVMLEGTAVVSKEGLKLDVRYEEPGFFGELGLMLDQKRAASVVAKTACRCVCIPKQVFRSVLLFGAAAQKALHKRHIAIIESNRRASSRSSVEAMPGELVEGPPNQMEDEEDADPDAFVTHATVAAVKAGVQRTTPGITPAEVEAYLHQGIWGPADEHHTEKKRWSRSTSPCQ